MNRTDSKLNILLVEDNAGDVRIIEEMIRDNAALDMICTDCLHSAVKLLNQDNIDVILLDLSLPDSFGLDTVNRIVALKPLLPVIILTGTKDDILAKNAIKKGAQDYLVKGQIDSVLLSRSIFYSIERAGLLRTIQKELGERKKAEEEVRKLNKELEKRVIDRTAQLEVANKELEAFSYSVSHDLRAPLRAVDGFSRILLEDHSGKLSSEGNRICKVICDNAKHMGHLIDDLLAFSRIGRTELQKSMIDMKTMAESVFFELTTPKERQRINFRLGALSPARGDLSMMRQVWMNLISNAIKFSSKRKSAVISIDQNRSEDKIVYFITDNGAGFDKKYADKLFGVFQRLHSLSDFDGTGVGLAIVQRIIHRHGGQVWAEGAVDKGASFYFSIPDNKI
jgi:signal transduction histidine kinase